MSTLDTVLCSEGSVESGSHVAKPYEFETHFLKDTGAGVRAVPIQKSSWNRGRAPTFLSNRIQGADTSKGM